MPAPKSERLLNLLIMLLVQRRPIAKARIRELLYPDSRPDAFEKMFERDKDELRSLGVPVEVAQLDPLFDDEIGYRIPPDQFALPDVSLTPEEAAVVSLASRVWQQATMAQATTDAVRKLNAAGIDVDLTALEIAHQIEGAPGITPGYDRLYVTGTVDLGNATLDLSSVLELRADDSYTLVHNDGADPVVGAFAGWAEGATSRQPAARASRSRIEAATATMSCSPTSRRFTTTWPKARPARSST